MKIPEPKTKKDIYYIASPLMIATDAFDIEKVKSELLCLREKEPEIHEQIVTEYVEHIYGMLDSKLNDLVARNSMDDKEARSLRKLVNLLVEVKGIQLGEGE